MSDELLALQHKRVLEILQESEQKKFMEERAKKSFNITALKEREEAGEPFEEDDEILDIYNHLEYAYLEYKKNEARKNGANPGTVGGFIRTESADKPI
ncbi:unnamed protein product [Rhizophagus irregularis]|uniref:Uncharacterized protein n=1 Tax=Rhizophagus irregularis TaxID=588596 RepID=A0A2N1MHQ9_9GLOM|nr:hypothetical protein RhiirC2_792234 [Rhizophagus irregularis]CAB4393449.1 unnamed protein product [Rhizophagus irregularis]